MKRKLKNIILTSMIIFFILSFIISANVDAMSIKDTFGGAANPTGSGPIKQIISAVLNLVRIAGAGIAVIILMTIAAKYLMASAGDRADIKKYAVNYIIGAIILFGATGILGIVQNFVNESVGS